MKSALFKLQSRSDDQESIAQILQEADIIFARDENGIATEGCGWNETRRIDEDHIEIAIRTTDEIMDMILQDPRLELITGLDGDWSIPEVVEELE